MIEMPQRAVTRFFVPLIDVLILLFCIFLLLPFVSAPTDGTSPDAPTDLDTLRAELKRVKDDLADEKKHTENLMKERTQSAERTGVWVVEIDGDTGEMTYAAFDGSGRSFALGKPEQASEFIQATKRKSGDKAVKFLFLCSRKKNARFPDAGTYQNIKDWFAGESVAFDNPFAAR